MCETLIVDRRTAGFALVQNVPWRAIRAADDIRVVDQDRDFVQGVALTYEVRVPDPDATVTVDGIDF